jgi:hypothetical protein
MISLSLYTHIPRDQDWKEKSSFSEFFNPNPCIYSWSSSSILIMHAVVFYFFFTLKNAHMITNGREGGSVEVCSWVIFSASEDEMASPILYKSLHWAFQSCLMHVLILTVETFCSSAFCPIHQYSKRNAGLIRSAPNRPAALSFYSLFP